MKSSDIQQKEKNHISKVDEVNASLTINMMPLKMSIILMVLMFVLAGVFTQGNLFKVIIRSFYPPKDIYADIVGEFLNDENFRKQLIYNTDYSKISIPGAGLKTFPKLNEDIPHEIWQTVSLGEVGDYEKMISRPQFFEAMSKHFSRLTNSFLVPNVNKFKRAYEIMAVGKIPQDVQILMVGKHSEGNYTAKCFQEFTNNELQAIVVIPESLPESEYSWFDCTFGWPTTTLKINNVDGIKLVGVRRNGKSNKLLVLVSQKTAKLLDLEGWESYKSNSYGKLVITDAE